MRVLITEKIHEAGPALLEARGLEVICKYDLSADELTKEIAGVDAMIVRSRIKVTRQLLASGGRLKVVGMHGIGVDHIDLAAAQELGVAVLNVPDGNIDSAAELAVSLMFAVARKVVAANNDVKSGGWNTNHFIGTQLCGKTLGIIALGKIGSRVATVCRAIGMDILVYDPYCSQEHAASLHASLTSLDELLTKADVITIHTPFTPETRHMIADEQIAKMKDGVILINAARGGVLSEQAAVRGLKCGKIGGIGLDVTEEEPPGKDLELLQFDNVTITPHIGARTHEAQVNVSKLISQKIADFLLKV